MQEYDRVISINNGDSIGTYEGLDGGGGGSGIHYSLKI